MDYAILAAPDPELLSAAARLHLAALSDRSFITLFGERFLKEIYRGLIERRIGFLVIARDTAGLAGFVLACTESARLMSVVTGSPLMFARLMAARVIRHPRSFRKVLETAFYGRRERSVLTAELLVIAVEPRYRSTGVGRALLGELRAELRSRGVAGYKVTVHAEMIAANRFYVENGLRLAGSFRLYGVRWNLYADELE